VLFKYSVRCGKLPDLCKFSMVAPIPKSTNMSELSDYILAYITAVHTSKMFGKAYNVILKHLVDYLSTRQWGFRSSHLCLVISDPWLATLERGQEVRAILFDNHKAFDCVPHRPELANYLTERCLFVNEAKSTPSPVLSGVPHG
jgi:hypothetical protein